GRAGDAAAPSGARAIRRAPDPVALRGISVEAPEYEGVLSLLSSSITASRPAGTGGVDLLAAGRITYLDLVVPRFFDDAPRIGFYDALVRLGHSREPGWRGQVVAITTGSHFEDADPSRLRGYEPLTCG